MSYSAKEALPLLLTRPSEPVFMPKGEDQVVALDVPDSFLTSRHQEIVKYLQDKWQKKGTQLIHVKNVTVPDISEIEQINREEMFLVFVKKHQEIAGKLIEIFLNQKTPEDLLSVAAYCHERLNAYLFNYALSVALLHRKDTKGINFPNYFQCFPGKFVPSNVTIAARQEATVIPREVRKPIIIPQHFTANQLEPEQRVAFFREDIGLNSHHWHWHLVYPTSGPTEVVSKDRRGELFYYMHQQSIVRYNTERLCAGIGYVKVCNIRDVITEGYFPKLVQGIASRAWPPRFANMTLKDVNRPADDSIVKLDSLDEWYAEIMEVVNNRKAVDAQGKEISLDNEKGIDILGNIVEANSNSINPKLYGDLHNFGHVLIAYCHDPDGRYNEGAAVMGDTATAMRDPVFYRWHSWINDILVTFKDKALPYTKDNLAFKGISIKEMKVVINGKPDNEFCTNWKESRVELSTGFDFTPLGAIEVQFTHLQHEDYTYCFTVDNFSNMEKLGYVRIFMALRHGENGERMDFNEQRKMMIELDRFSVRLRRGFNMIRRKSTDSSVSIPFNRTFDSTRTDNFCGCGWPHYLLIPKGTEDGKEFDLFVMITDYAQDRVNQDTSGPCNDAESYCGIRDKKYPDKKPMGYPFDRRGPPHVRYLENFLTPNMKTQTVKIKFTNKIDAVEEYSMPNISVMPAHM